MADQQPLTHAGKAVDTPVSSLSHTSTWIHFP